MSGERISCECCGAPIAQPVVTTIAGDFLPPWGMCRSCWRLVSKVLRRALVWARVAFRGAPHLEEIIAYYHFWNVALVEAQLKRSMRRAA